MERLTSPTLKQNFKHCVDAWSDELLRKEYWKLYDRLAAYEDTGLTPEEVNACKHALMGRGIAKITEFKGISLDRLEEICNAERDGRLVIVPFKRGDAVYYFGQRNCICEAIVTGRLEFEVECPTNIPEDYRFVDDFGLHEIGKTVFLTREAAETALKEREQDDD